jgi:Glycosyltransferase family 87
VPFVDLRRPRRLLHLDLLVLLSFGISYWFFNRGDVLTSVPLVYPVLAYLLGRALWAGLRPQRRSGPLVPHLPVTVLAVGLVLLAGGRVALNLVNDRVIDVGYASVVGADRISHKLPLYVDNDVHGDTYGPVNYLAYVPFESALPWHGTWDGLPAAHAATIAFDLLTIVGLVLLGMRLRAGPRGRRLGLALGWAWAAFPFTLLGVMLNTNDGLVAMLLVGALLGLASPAARGAMLGLAAGAKFVPAALAPLFARGLGGRVSWRHAGVFTAVFALVVALPVLLYLPDGGVREFYDTTIGFQLGRTSVFSPWGLHPDTAWLGTLQTLLEVGAVALALLVAVFPRGPRTPAQVAALGAAVLIAVQLPATHWFYFYVVWFTPFLLVALFSEHADDEPAPVVAESERPQERVPVAA